MLTTTCESITGNILYSDEYVWHTQRGGERTQGVNENLSPNSSVPLLNTLAKIPYIGMYAGLFRMCLAIIHIAGHMLAVVFMCNCEHFYHVAKGGAEFLRGFIELIPIFGRLFAWCWSPCPSEIGPQGYCSYFLIRIENPNHPNPIHTLMRTPNVLIAEQGGRYIYISRLPVLPQSVGSSSAATAATQAVSTVISAASAASSAG